MSHEDDREEENRRQQRREALHSLYDSAIEAEQQTGRKEEDVQEARRSLMVRTITIFFGSVISILGLMMMVLPGPGLLVLAIGLGILTRDVPFAHRLLQIVKSRLPQDETGKLTKKTIIGMVAIAAAGIIFSAVSVWLTFFN